MKDALHVSRQMIRKSQKSKELEPNKTAKEPSLGLHVLLGRGIG